MSHLEESGSVAQNVRLGSFRMVTGFWREAIAPDVDMKAPKDPGFAAPTSPCNIMQPGIVYDCMLDDIG